MDVAGVDQMIKFLLLCGAATLIIRQLYSARQALMSACEQKFGDTRGPWACLVIEGTIAFGAGLVFGYLLK